MDHSSLNVPSATGWQTATVAEIGVATPRIKTFLLSPARPFLFRPGQHVELRLTAPDGYSATRSYSIASAPCRSSVIELAIERLADGEVSPYMHDFVAAGDTVEVRGPLGGHFVWESSDGGPVLLIGGGSGLVPLMSMIRHKLAVRSSAPVVLLQSSRSESDLLYRNELLEARDRFGDFRLLLTYTRSRSPSPEAYCRRIDMEMLRDAVALLPEPPKSLFICGNNAFCNQTSDLAVASGIPASVVRTERYGA